MNAPRLPSLALAALGALSCSTQDSLGERGGALGRSGAAAQTDASTRVDTGGRANGGISGAGALGSGASGAAPAIGGAGGRGRGGAAGSPPVVSGGAPGATGGGGALADGSVANAGGSSGATGTPDGGGPRTLRIVTPTMAVPVGAEIFRCYHARVPSSVDVQATAFSSTAPALNELMVYRETTESAPEGTLGTSGCTVSFAAWWYAAYAADYSLRMPSGVAAQLGASQPLILDMHFVNSGGAPITTSVTLAIELGDGRFDQVAAMVAFNTGIAIPPNGTQNVVGDCMLPANTKLFSLTTHTNALATDASVSRTLASGQPGEVLVRSTDYAHPVVATWAAPSFLTLLPGEKLHYSCSYKNDRASTVTVGTSALSNEMCMVIGYLFPAPASAPSCN